MKSATSETPLGLFQFNDTEKSVVIDGQFTSVKALENLDIPLSAAAGDSQSQGDDGASSQGAEQQASASQSATTASSSQSSDSEVPSVKLKEIAQVSAGDERASISKTNGKDAVNVQITKAQDANTVQVAKDTKRN